MAVVIQMCKTLISCFLFFKFSYGLKFLLCMPDDCSGDVCSGCLDPDKFNEFKLVKKTQLSQNTARFRFSLPTPTSVLGLPVGQHIICRFSN